MFYLALGLLSVALPISACAQTSAPSTTQSDITGLLSSKLASASVQYAERLSQCRSLGSSRPVDGLITSSELQKRGISKEDAVAAIGHVYFTNQDLCSRAEMLEFTYQLSNMQHLKNELSIDQATIEKANTFAPYKAVKQLQLEVRFKQLPMPTQQYFLNALGDQPFDYLKLLESI